MNPTPRQVITGGIVFTLATLGTVAGAVAQTVDASHMLVVLFALLAAVVGAGIAWCVFQRLRPTSGGKGWWLIAAALGGSVLVSAPNAVQTVTVSGCAGFLIVALPTICRNVLAARHQA